MENRINAANTAATAEVEVIGADNKSIIVVVDSGSTVRDALNRDEFLEKENRENTTVETLSDFIESFSNSDGSFTLVGTAKFMRDAVINYAVKTGEHVKLNFSDLTFVLPFDEVDDADDAVENVCDGMDLSGHAKVTFIADDVYGSSVTVYPVAGTIVKECFTEQAVLDFFGCTAEEILDAATRLEDITTGDETDFDDGFIGKAAMGYELEERDMFNIYVDLTPAQPTSAQESITDQQQQPQEATAVQQPMHGVTGTTGTIEVLYAGGLQHVCMNITNGITTLKDIMYGPDLKRLLNYNDTQMSVQQVTLTTAEDLRNSRNNSDCEEIGTIVAPPRFVAYVLHDGDMIMLSERSSKSKGIC